ncbi:MAG: RagB/SusD family nutrient uptake outer membrane protein [Bacteroidota bacterium]
MKHRINYTIALALVLISTSCNDWLQLLPPGGLIREEYWKTEADVKAVLMAAYESFSTMDASLFILGEIRADMIQGDIGQPTGEELLMESNIFPDNDICSWSEFYSVINYANEVIKNAPLVQEIDNTFTDFEKQGLMSEAYFIRSLAYFYLVRLYGEVPLVLEPTETDDADFYLPKSPEDVVLDQMVADLEANRPFAPSGGFATLAENKGRASKPAFDALLADIALWRFDYAAVVEHVERIEEIPEIDLVPGSMWFEIFYPGNSPEGILEFQFDGNLGQRNGTFSLTSQYSYRYDPSQASLNMFASEYDSREVVRGEGASIVEVAEDDYIIWKYVGRAPDGASLRSGNEQFSCNWIVYRYADIMLMKAEALSQMNQFTAAGDILNEIRTRAGLNPALIPSNPVAYEDAIMDERARELAYEGKRWFDLMRLGRRNNYARKSKLIEVIISNVPPTQKRILSAKLTNPLGWYLPIFEDEIERNKNLVQNPYYED